MSTEYVLGRDVTEQAKAREKRGTVIISFRIKGNEFDVLARVAQDLDRSISEVARQAFRTGMMPSMPTNTAGNTATWVDGSGN